MHARKFSFQRLELESGSEDVYDDKDIQDETDEGDVVSLTLDHIQGIFYLYGVAIILATITLLLENCYFALTKHN